MIILNQILQETVSQIRLVNKLKCDFWAKATHTGSENSLQDIFDSIKADKIGSILEKKDLEDYLALHSVRGKFIDSFFYGNSVNENFMVFSDIHQYMMKYIKISEVLTAELQSLSLDVCFKAILAAEQRLFELLEHKKKNLICTFQHPSELFSFLKMLFEDISTFSVRNHMKIMDFQKANTKLRLNHNFDLLSASDISYLQNYFHLNCDSGISFEEFIFMFCDYVSLQTNLQSQLHVNINNCCNESFLPVNIIPASMRFNIDNFKSRPEGVEDKSLGLKGLLLKGMTSTSKEIDTIYLKKNEQEQDHQSINVSRNSYMVANQSVHSRILNDSNLNLSAMDKQKNERQVQGVVEIIKEPALNQPSVINQSQNKSQSRIILQSADNKPVNMSALNKSGLNLPDGNQSEMNRLSQMSYPQINIHQHPPNFEENSYLVPIEESRALNNHKEESDIYHRVGLDNDILEDDSDNLSQLDKTIRENILEFRY
jgi:hypothetical protein